MDNKDFNTISNEYTQTSFRKMVDEYRESPHTLKSKRDLLEFWRLATKERSLNKSIQGFIASDAARTYGDVELDQQKDKKYIDIITQFL